MNVNLESPSALRRKLTIELEPDEIKTELDRAYNELTATWCSRAFAPAMRRATARATVRRPGPRRGRAEAGQGIHRQGARGARTSSPCCRPKSSPRRPTCKGAALQRDLRSAPEIEVRITRASRCPSHRSRSPTTRWKRRSSDCASARPRSKRSRIAPWSSDGDYALAAIEAFEDGKPLEGTKIDERLLEVSGERARPWARRSADRRRSRQAGARHAKLRRRLRQKDLAGKTVEWRATVKEIYTKRAARARRRVRQGSRRRHLLEELRAKVREQLLQRARRRPTRGRARDCSIS